MINCIDCEWLVRWWKDEHNKEHFVECSKASPEVRECEGYKSAKRKLIKEKERKQK